MKLSKESKIAVVCGGVSSEREISLRSGSNCFNAIKKLNYSNVVLIDIKNVLDIFRLKDLDIEIVFLVTHGELGEDGAIQGILEWLEIPYTGSSIIGSAISMDKWLTKKIASSIGILTPAAILITELNFKNSNLNQAWKELSKRNNAVFLKPRDSGSSVNTFKIRNLDELIEKTKKIDLKISDYILEEFIPGRELTISIIENKEKLQFLPVLELKPKNEFYDYESKYTKGMTEFILPAKIEKSVLNRLENESLKIFNEIGCSSFGRVDYILDGEVPYLLEINSLPGMTDTSDLPAQANAAGIKYDELVETILMSAKTHKKHLNSLFIKQNS